MIAVTAALSEAQSVDDVASVILELGFRAVKATRGYLLEVGQPGIVLLGVRGEGVSTIHQTLAEWSIAETPLDAAVTSGTAVWLASGEEFRSRYPKVFALLGSDARDRSHAVLPLTHRGEIVGAIGMSFARAAAFSAGDRAFTLLLARATAAALRRARVFDTEREKRRQAELLARVRHEVLRVVAHDLRNPLQLLLASGEMLVDSSLTPDRRQQIIGVTRRAGDRMQRLISDLLDTVRLQAGRLALELDVLTLGDILTEVQESFLPMADERGIHFSVHTPRPDFRVHADAARIQQALGNLIGNAIKFTERDGYVRCEALPAGEHALFHVIDTGIGIPADRFPHLFEEFWQERTGDRRGIGLGLVIAKGIVESHGGQIRVESAAGQGSNFSFTILAPPVENVELLAEPPGVSVTRGGEAWQ